MSARTTSGSENGGPSAARQSIASMPDPPARLLVVEDEDKVARALQEGLEGEGYEVAVERTGEGAFFRLNTEPFDLVLLDVMLPGRDGLQILTTLRERRRDSAGAAPDRARHARGSRGRPQSRRRRLSGETVRLRGSAGAHASAPAPGTRGGRSGPPRLERPRDEPRQAGGHPRRRRGRAHGPRVRVARVSAPARGAGRLAGGPGARRVEGNRAIDAARQRYRRPHRQACGARSTSIGRRS